MKISIQIDQDNPVPLHGQIYQALRRLILTGQAAPGTRLPASRALARQCAVARGTVLQAYAQLEAEGYLVSKRGAGTFVAESLTEVLARETAVSAAIPPFQPTLSGWADRLLHSPASEKQTGPRLEIDFGFGRSFPHIFPYDIWRRLLARYLSTDDIMLARYGSAAGFMPLRQALADYLARQRGVHCDARQIVIVNGVQQALDILARLLLRKGDDVIVESPGYVTAYELFRVHGARLRPLPVDEHGLPVDQIPKSSNGRFVFVTPANQFPHGGTMPLVRRLALLQWARAHDAIIIEDDYDSELRYDCGPISALHGLDKDGRVVYFGTFSKVLFPALRLAYVVLPPSLLTPFMAAKRLVDRGAPTLTQAAVADFITEGHFENHLRRLRKVYGQRWQLLVQSLTRTLPTQVRFAAVPAGLHLMLYLQTAVSEAQLIKEAAALGVGLYAGASYHVLQPAPPSILLGFSGLAAADIEEGVRRLATLLPAASSGTAK